jgi:hypothetical protein
MISLFRRIAFLHTLPCRFRIPEGDKKYNKMRKKEWKKK